MSFVINEMNIKFPIPILAENFDKNQNIICYVKLDGTILYNCNIPGWQIDILGKNNIIVIHENDIPPKNCVISTYNNSSICIMHSKYMIKSTNITIGTIGKNKIYISEDFSSSRVSFELKEGKYIYIYI